MMTSVGWFAVPSLQRLIEGTIELSRNRLGRLDLHKNYTHGESDMSSFSVFESLPEDPFQCPLCLKVFSDPVTTPCGHSFCKSCLSERWDKSDSCSCPMCSKRFRVRPETSTNAVIREISVRIKRRRAETPETPETPEMPESAPGEVKCDVCTEVKFAALKSCLVCLTSFCGAHLDPHRRVPSLMRHKLVDPLEDLEERVCEKHQRILELFCRDDQTCVCLLCGEADHKGHDVVPVEEEGAQQKENVEAQKAKIKMMIEDRMDKMKEFSDASGMSREKANRELADGEKLFGALMDRVRVAGRKLKANIDKKLVKAQERDAEVMEELQDEVARLQRRHSELEELSQRDDQLQFLQTLQALGAMSDTRNWSEIRVYSDLCVQTLRRAMTHLVHAFQSELKTLTDAELTRMRQHKASVAFDPDTAGCFLVVSDVGKRLKYNKRAKPSSPDDSERFNCPMVFGTKGFTSGRHYWEVQVGLRNDWDIGVAKEAVDRKESVTVKRENGFFAIGKSGFDYKVQCTPYTVLHLCPRPRHVGVYVDYNEGRVSFYDVDRKLHVYSFTGESFTEKLFPYFYLYSGAKKSEPLLIRSMEDYSSYRSLIRSSSLRIAKE
ncbi:E3 ubiquitin-protein ligase TRIM39-like [Clinocottus analis]|uniref:E3 ubiquitin-protein ligase TRIM39-like n=1 Tax=Clinocottus analis TaxID=304258 RepID=UPI0035C2554B